MKYFDVLSVQVCQDTGRWLFWRVSSVQAEDASHARAKVDSGNDARGVFSYLGASVRLQSVNVGVSGLFDDFIGKCADDMAREALNRRRNG